LVVSVIVVDALDADIEPAVVVDADVSVCVVPLLPLVVSSPAVSPPPSSPLQAAKASKNAVQGMYSFEAIMVLPHASSSVQRRSLSAIGPRIRARAGVCSRFRGVASTPQL
jgi:hypothetical protein